MQRTRGNIDVVLENRGPLILRPNDHVATGGEGAVYKASNTIVKLYTDVNKMQKDDMMDKIKILSTFKHKFIVAPNGLVFSNMNIPLGFYMKFVKAEPLSRVFTNDFRKRENFTDNNASVLVDGMREVVSFAHNKKAVLVDANEMNWLVMLSNQKDPEPRIIDVDSWAIGKWPAKVIMPSIRDWHANNFNQSTDWFAWGIVTFQIFTGIHPYKGRLKGYKPNDIERRMKKNASVFSPNIRLNSAVRDFSTIPGPLLDWYVATFQKGQRSIPPSPLQTGIATTQLGRVMRVVITASGTLTFNKLLDSTADPVIRIFPCGIVMSNSGKLLSLSNQRQISIAQSHKCEIVKVQNGWLKADVVDQQIKFSYINEVSLEEIDMSLNLKTQQLVRYQNRLFVVTERGLTEIILKVLGKPILSVGQTWGVMVNSTQWFDGVGIQDTLGAMYVVAPFNDNSCVQIRVKELDGLKPIVAKSGNRFIAVIALDKTGAYQKIELTMDRSYANYKMAQGTVDVPELNIAILPKGVCSMIVNDGELDIFVPTSGILNKV
ncbi:hypothetical protein ACFL1Y_01680, partial [Patescibacteria group bacterium]